MSETDTIDPEYDIWNEGRRELTVQSKAGHKFKVIIKKVGMGQMPQVHKADQGLLPFEEEALLYIESIESLADGSDIKKSSDWFETLEPETQLAIVEKGAAIQAPLLQRWIGLQESKQEKRLLNLEAEAKKMERENKSMKTIRGFDKSELVKEVLKGDAKNLIGDFIKSDIGKQTMKEEMQKMSALDDS